MRAPMLKLLHGFLKVFPVLMYMSREDSEVTLRLVNGDISLTESWEAQTPLRLCPLSNSQCQTHSSRVVNLVTSTEAPSHPLKPFTEEERVI